MSNRMFTERDLLRLKGVHPDLVRVMSRARLATDFMVIEGLRTAERQAELVARGASQTLKSRHLTGHAVDIAPTLHGQPMWDWPLYHPMAAAVMDAANAESVAIIWGGTWTKFRDGPHFELDRTKYR